MKINKNLSEILTLWERTNQIRDKKALQSNLTASDLIASFFCPGEFYYFILNFFDNSFEYVHPNVQKVLGCDPESFHFGLIFEKLHPEDIGSMPQKEQAAAEFYFHRNLPLEKIPLYKSTYTFRINDGKGGWKNILHQSLALQVSEEGKIQFALCVHSDITFINPIADNHISFIGLQGEPSYFALSTSPGTMLQPVHTLNISPREKEIVQWLAYGFSSKQIGEQLFLSKHTVDTHRRNLLHKTGAKNTHELIALCLKLGLI